MQRIIIKKGYQLRMNGRPKKEVVSLPAPSQIGLVPMWIPYILIPIGALFLSLQYIVNILEIIQSLISKDSGIEKPAR